MALLRMKRLHTQEDPQTGNVYWILHNDALALAGESQCYYRVLRMNLPPDVQTALSNGQAVAMEIDLSLLIESPKNRDGDLWPHAPKEE